MRLVVNMAKSPGEADMVADRLNSVLREFVQWEVDYVGHILTEAQVARAVAEQHPFCLPIPTAGPAAPSRGSPGFWPVGTPQRAFGHSRFLCTYRGFYRSSEGVLCRSYQISW